ncbi:MAG TPA: hypothetical protein VMU51_17640 [Mycobacteriales bacterium]|nr:hypothetical protein [Mycobacteriales bacterium]
MGIGGLARLGTGGLAAGWRAVRVECVVRGAEQAQRAAGDGGRFVQQGGGALGGEPAEIHGEGVVHAVSGEGAEGVGQISAGVRQFAGSRGQRTDPVAEVDVGLGIVRLQRRGGLAVGGEPGGAVLHVVPSAPVGGDIGTIFPLQRCDDQATKQ